MASGSGGSSLDFGEPYFINPTGIHKATIVWLHDIGKNGLDAKNALANANMTHTNVKWIFPTAPIRSVTYLGGKKTNAWFDLYTQFVDDMEEDFGSLNYATTYIAILLSTEPLHVMKGVGGMGMGATQALFFATSYVFGRVPVAVNFVIGMNGWLPDLRSFQSKMSKNYSHYVCAASLPILVTYKYDDSYYTIPYEYVNKCVDSLRSVGFQTSFKLCGGYDAMKEIRLWFRQYFGIAA